MEVSEVPDILTRQIQQDLGLEFAAQRIAKYTAPELCAKVKEVEGLSGDRLLNLT